MKKCLIFLLTAICILGTSGCGHQNVTAAPSVSTAASIEKVKIVYGNSALYSEEDMNAAIQLIMDTFSTWEGCELHSISYVSDEKCNSENIAWMNELAKANDLKEQFDQCILFQSDFHSPKENSGAWEPDEEYTDWQWWLARSEGGPWILMTNGYG